MESIFKIEFRLTKDRIQIHTDVHNITIPEILGCIEMLKDHMLTKWHDELKNRTTFTNNEDNNVTEK